MQTIRQFTSFLLLFTALLTMYSTNTYAQPCSMRTSVGVVYLPLHDWSSFFGELSNSFYSKNNPNLCYSLSVHYTLNSSHSVNIGTELIKSTASSSGPMGTVNWKFQGIPITLGYEYTAFKFNDHYTPILGAGISYFMSEVDAHENFFNQTLKRYGNGYGVHASLGLNSELTQALSMISQVRYRYSDGMAFTDSKGAIKVEFTGFDFSTGLRWNF